ncbi:molybdate ABC transporter substrate-binding protein [Ketogulonicigenium vulgare]|uniref:Molybdate-binding periplasmic permease protein n=1 Tax=Ketogulonicigenium vulgare (strain WSH-001) TaxID=759362 RepID=F9Y4B9_KETVW|nr:molybdate ABC transporter substrate-binding protein [Ketogulonicigenium vulgare]ADO43448.1 putative molybdate-binding periplasmic ABC transporter protein [Ketogulonicigenium vulgare Y25]AEM41732.1 Molybdate-binding periplasmic permease protein [Ketogulonicigenium vulgare WSH-001]ALJ81839.1 molybdenum ABC transporter substrate-binding protein [Ketogulonicigenium vulgare]ANW34495.1 molybdate ABC transporter substrate-binding protein [Ketogulonicigenium vulgare]AOZ55485.1 molybdate-binding per
MNRKIAFAATLIGGLMASSAMAEDITVFAAASMKDSLDAVIANWTAETGNTVTVSYEGSSALARQIEQGAPAAMFISAAIDWMDYVEGLGLIEDGTRSDLLGNSLVIVSHEAPAAPVTIDANLDLIGLLGDEKLAMALVDSVPAGVYGKEALTNLGLWDSVAPNVAQADNVRAALALVGLGEAPYGIVYSTDAAADPNVAIYGTFPADSHGPITYPVALIKEYSSDTAHAFLDYLKTPAASDVFTEFGFVTLQ